MKILALETANDPGSIALWLDGEIYAAECPTDTANSQTLLPLALSLLHEHALDFAAIDAIAFGEGPGSFTGLRVSCGLAQGFALARELPLLGINSLAGMAWQAKAARVIVTLDARMGEVYYGVFVDQVLQGEMGVCPPHAIPLPEGTGWTIVGNALAAYPELHAHFAPLNAHFLPAIYPQASAIAALAAPRLARGDKIDAADAHPVYVRDKVAQTVAERLANGGRA